MNTIIKQALQLPKEEKLELYFALQEDLDDELEDEELTKEQWEQLNEISRQIDDGSVKKILEEEMMMFLKKEKMAYHLTFSELTQQQIAEALDYYNEISVSLSDQLEEDLFATYARLKEHLYHYFNLNKNFRRINLTHFSYQIIYRIFKDNNEVFIAALFHQLENPRKIKKLK